MCACVCACVLDSEWAESGLGLGWVWTDSDRFRPLMQTIDDAAAGVLHNTIRVLCWGNSLIVGPQPTKGSTSGSKEWSQGRTGVMGQKRELPSGTQTGQNRDP